MKPSSNSKSVSPLTLTVTSFDVSPAAKFTVPEGNAVPKSAATAGFVPLPVTANFTLPAPEVAPLRVTVNVNGLVAVLPSALVASATAIAKAESSFVIVPMAVMVPREAPVGFESVTSKVSVGSTVVSPATLIVMTCEV